MQTSSVSLSVNERGELVIIKGQRRRKEIVPYNMKRVAFHMKKAKAWITNPSRTWEETLVTGEAAERYTNASILLEKVWGTLSHTYKRRTNLLRMDTILSWKKEAV